MLSQPLVHGPQARSVLPEYAAVLRQPAEKFQGVAILILVGAIEPDDDFIQVGHAREFAHDIFERRGFELRIQGRQHESQQAMPGKFDQLLLQFLDGSLRQVVQRRDLAVLVKVTH